MDLTSYLIASVILGAVGLAALYFVIKAAVKNALHEDRLFQAKVQQSRGK
ncbi:hypothetical protein [Microbacterium sp. PM5]|nr:hypothetical protein [Microbacterium sp. PM5]